jgi:hypothetical protein
MEILRAVEIQEINPGLRKKNKLKIKKKPINASFF